MKNGIIVLFVLLLLGCTAERQVLPELAAEKMNISEISGYDEQKRIIQDRFLLKTNQKIEFSMFKVHYSPLDISSCGCCSSDEIVFITQIPVNELLNKEITTKEHLSEFLKALNQKLPSDLVGGVYRVYSFILLNTKEVEAANLQQKVLTHEEFEILSNEQKIDASIYLCGRTFRYSDVEF